MNKKPALALTLAILATLCFIAGSPSFAFIPTKVANFVGIALVLVAGLCWALPSGKKPD